MLENIINKTKIGLVFFSLGAVYSGCGATQLNLPRFNPVNNINYQQYCNNNTVDDLGCINVPLYDVSNFDSK